MDLIGNSKFMIVSFGSFINPAGFPLWAFHELLEALMAFKNLTFLMKYKMVKKMMKYKCVNDEMMKYKCVNLDLDEELIKQNATNIKIFEWLPQTFLLGLFVISIIKLIKYEKTISYYQN